ncbi:MAG: serine/threonine-protein phosphatase [Verrucomicrobia bacterium]|nr:serine/threonine-protein phosphatase [Verrucomicrobiota bacterium]
MSDPALHSHNQSPATTQLVWSGMTHCGRFRKNNEDSFLALTFDGHHVNYLGKIGEAPLAAMDFVFAISDGMGGANSGEFASKIAVEKITKLLPRSFRMGARGLGSDFADILPELYTAIHNEMIKLGQCYEECSGMGATLSLCWFTPEWMYFGHIGDSRIYYLPKIGDFTQLTHDHTHVGWLRRKGRINEREARTHPQRNSLNQALGAGNQIIDPHIGAVGCQPGDRFLICSDGLTDGLWDKRIEELLRTTASTHDLARLLVEESVAESGRDNTTAVVIEIMPATLPPS